MANNPAFRLYEAQNAPRPADTPGLRAPDLGPGIGASLSRAAGAIKDVADAQLTRERADVEIEQERRRRAEDDGRIRAAAASAEFSAAADAARRDVLDQAPHGYEGVTQSTAARYAELRDQFRARPELAGSPEALRFFDEATARLQPQFLDQTAELEANGRDRWQTDTVSETVDTLGNDLISNPTHYDHNREVLMATLGGISNAGLRERATSRAEQALAASAVAGMINANPSEALRLLRSDEPPDLVARLSPEQRDRAISNAQSEIGRRQAQYANGVAQAASAAQARWALGLDAPNAPTFEAVYQTLGPAQALQYETTRLAGESHGELSDMSAADLTRIIAEGQTSGAGRVPTGRSAGDGSTDEMDVIRRGARAQAAAQILEERRTDPMQIQVRRGTVPESDIVGAASQGDWSMVAGILANRSAAAERAHAAQGVRAAPLTNFEASALGNIAQNMDWRKRSTLFRNLRAWMGGDSESFRQLTRQLFPSSPATAYAGYIAGVGGNGDRNGEIILRGVDALAGRDPAAQASQGGQAPPTRANPLNMPEESALQRSWQNNVGLAYSGAPNGSSMVNAERASYEAFRAAYAGLSYDAHDFSGQLNSQRAFRAAAIATGGFTDWHGRRTLLPYNMSFNAFEAGVRAGFNRWDALRNQNPRDYGLVALGAGTGPNTYRYAVLNGQEPLMVGGRPVEIEVRR